MTHEKPFSGIILPANPQGWEPLAEITLEALQEAVGGYVTVVNIPHGTLWAIDEAMGQSVNIYALLLFGQVLFGNVVVTGGVDEEGNTKALGRRWRQAIAKRIPVAKRWRNDVATWKANNQL